MLVFGVLAVPEVEGVDVSSAGAGLVVVVVEEVRCRYQPPP